MLNILSKLLDFIYKKRCYFCNSSKDNSFMCSKCYKKLSLLPFRTLRYINETPIYSALIYENEIQKLIRGIKYHNQKDLAFFQAQIMYDYWKNLPISNENFLIIPTPLYAKREKKRKYNHMLLVAEEFAKLTNYQVCNSLITRIKDTKPQYKLTKKQREKNLHNAFACNTQNYNQENILLIDDILTTGSTISEMIKTFHQHDIKNITVFVTSCTKYNLN
jgi:ComF family protein